MGANSLLMRIDQWSRSQAPPRVLWAGLTSYTQTAAPAFAGAGLLEIAHTLPVTRLGSQGR